MCDGCNPTGIKELFIPAPLNADVDAQINSHLETRNFFAWLYNIPLAGRALGRSLIGLKRRLDEYRPDRIEQNLTDVLAYIERQRYSDFRECVDHALAVLQFAETYELENLWIDAFTHTVGMSRKGMKMSLEYLVSVRRLSLESKCLTMMMQTITPATKSLIAEASRALDLKLEAVNHSINTFFEYDLSQFGMGLPQATRDHFDRFRSFLQAYYIEQYGFWPPENFETEPVWQALHKALYSDFRTLYHHLVDPLSTPNMTTTVNSAGGVCTWQHIQTFDQRRQYEPIPHPLPKCPDVPPLDSARPGAEPRRNPINPLRKRQANREMRQELEAQALVDASNRDWSIMSSLLVRRYSDFEQQSVLDDFEKITIEDGRKVRWIAIYAILQTLISVMQAPKQVRDAEGLSYLLCVTPPTTFPWSLVVSSGSSTSDTTYTMSPIEPDMDMRTVFPDPPPKTKAERRNSNLSKSSLEKSETMSTSSSATSLRRLISRKTSAKSSKIPEVPKRPAFYEIIVQGYGNGLNQVNHDSSSISSSSSSDVEERKSSPGSETARSEQTERPRTPPTPSASVSRESSSASGYTSGSNRSSNTSNDSATGDRLPAMDHLSIGGGDREGKDLTKVASGLEVGQIHFDTRTWDQMLRF